MNDGLMLQPFEASNILVMAICLFMELPLHHHYFRRIFSISIPVYMSKIPRSFKSFNHFFQTDVVPSNQIAIFRKNSRRTVMLPNVAILHTANVVPCQGDGFLGVRQAPIGW